MEADSNKELTIESLPWVEENLEHLLTHPLVKATYLDLQIDFNRCYKEMMDKPIGDISPESISGLRDMKTELFQAFVVGSLNSFDPDSRFSGFCARNLVPPAKEEPSKLIFT